MEREALTLLDLASSSGLRVSIEAGELIVRGPRSAGDLADEVIRRKAEVVAALRDRDASPPGYGDAYDGDLPSGPTLLTGGFEDPAPFDWASGEPLPWEDLAARRWGPAVGDPEPGLDVPADSWRWVVANWPPDRWSAWHRRAAELEPPGADADAIRTAQRRAYDELVGVAATVPEVVASDVREVAPNSPKFPNFPPVRRGDAWEGDAPAEDPQSAQPEPTAPVGGDAPAAEGWDADPPSIEGFQLLPEAEWPAFAIDRSLTITVDAYRASVELDRATREAMARLPRPAKRRAGRSAGQDRPD